MEEEMKDKTKECTYKIKIQKNTWKKIFWMETSTKLVNKKTK
jgi:hypothetical protein